MQLTMCYKKKEMILFADGTATAAMFVVQNSCFVKLGGK